MGAAGLSAWLPAGCPLAAWAVLDPAPGVATTPPAPLGVGPLFALKVLSATPTKSATEKGDHYILSATARQWHTAGYAPDHTERKSQ